MKNKIYLLTLGILISTHALAKSFNCTAAGETVGFSSTPADSIGYDFYDSVYMGTATFKLNDNAAGIHDNVSFGPKGKLHSGQPSEKRLAARIMSFQKKILILTLNDDDIVSTDINAGQAKLSLYRSHHGSPTNFSLECNEE